MASEQAAELVRLRIEGMGCDGCVVAVRQALEAVPGVLRADVDLDRATAAVATSAPVDPGDLVAAVDRAGYGATVA